jgi:FkbM family methyltransferase
MNPLTRRILWAPEMWPAAAQVKIAQAIGRKEVTVRRAGLSITCGTGNGQGAFCAVAGPSYEPELRWLLRQLKPHDTFVDVGANIGIYSMQVARWLNHSGAVFSLEPSPDAVRILKENIALNGFGKLVAPIHAAASRSEGQLYLAGDPTKWNSLQLHEQPPGIPIRVTTVDNVLDDSDKLEHFQFLKIDAEGVETDVLEGAWKSIQATWPRIIFENSLNRCEELPTSWLESRGYKIYALEPNGKLKTAVKGDYPCHTNLVGIHPCSRSSSNC